MAKIVNFSINLDKIDESKLIKGKKGTYLNLTGSVNDEVNEFGDDFSVYLSQSKEEREAKQKRMYIGNGRVVWSSEPKSEDIFDL